MSKRVKTKNSLKFRGCSQAYSIYIHIYTVYNVRCKNCEKVCTGQTSYAVETRIKEQK